MSASVGDRLPQPEQVAGGCAAPRFLLPANAPPAVPVADLLVRFVRAPGRIRRPLAVTLLALALAGRLAAQLLVTARRAAAAHRGWAAVVAGLHRLGVVAPRRVTGANDVPTAYSGGCSSAATIGHDAYRTSVGIRRTARRLPGCARSWTRRQAAGVHVYAAPVVTAGGRP
ncbi:hypothetical protein [Streptomyces griseoloalbus]|uniref:Uncharacterized protein n=1 Tax=Streptomyces griseoloalbus TaxID=67303 RepID=A0A7W8F9B3_9ACTN|nr:hypothetical protein [Streptomyces albaduncus]MBB5126109.1 hypothetical protein [Streptomyces albaduncus]